MQIENNSAHTSPLYTRATPTAENTKTGQASTLAPSQSAETGTAVTAKAAAVTGTTGSRLSAETDGYMIQASQEGVAPQQSGALTAAEKRYLTSIADGNMQEGMDKYAKMFASSLDAVSWKKILAEGPPASSGGWGHRTGPSSNVQNQREALYDSEIAKGTPPAEIIMRIMEFNANLPQSYGDSLEQPGLSDPGAWNKHQQAMADYLKQAIAQANSSEATGELS